MKIYVGNLAYEVTDHELRQAFEPYGQIESVDVITDRQTGRSKGFGFVEMPSQEEAKAAIEGLNDTEIMGRAVTVNEARPRKDNRGGGRRGGRGRY